MAITVGTTAYLGKGPAESGQIVSFGGSELRNFAVGKVTLTGDGAASSATINWIDGTKTLPFTPSRVLAFRVGGNAAATISVASLTSVTNTGALCTLSAAPANTTTLDIVFLALP